MDIYSSLLLDTQYIFDEKLGEGASGTVCLAHHSRTNETSVVKIFSRKHFRSYYKEKKALESLQVLPNIIKLEKALHGPEFAYLFLERGTIDLYQLLTSPSSSNSSFTSPPFTSPPQIPSYLSEDIAREFFKQMFNAVFSVHKAGFVHHDIKLENFLLSLDGQVKLIDFGYSLQFSDDRGWMDLTSHAPQICGAYNAGSPAYSSQQVLVRKPHSPMKTDIYGLGVCLYRMLTGHFPWCDPDSDTLDTLKANIEIGNLEFPPELSLSYEVRDLLQGMLAKLEVERFDWNHISQHAWMRL